MKATLKTAAVSEDLVRDLINAIRDRQEQRGENLADTNAYTLGYIGSMLANILAESPKARAYVKSTTKYVVETK